MDRRPLGDSGLDASVLALGTWAMGASVETWGNVDDRESIAAIHQALDAGINLIDTAPMYGHGHAEQIVGKAIQGRRDDVLLATHCGVRIHDAHGQRRPPAEAGTPVNHRPVRCLSRDSILRECEESLRRLRVEVIDLYQCHWPDPDTPIRETMDALNSLRERDLIRAIGLSNFSCEQITEAREYGPVHVVQTPFSMLNRRAADDLMPFCRERHIAVLANSALVRGLLSGKFGPDDEFTDLRARDSEFRGQNYQRNLRIIDSLRPLAAAYDKTVAQLVLQWTLSQPGITALIVGAKRPSQVLENIGAIGWSIRDEDRAAIERILQDVGRET